VLIDLEGRYILKIIILAFVIGLITIVLTLSIPTLFVDKGGLFPDHLRVGVLPDETSVNLMHRYQPLMDYLTDKTSLTTTFIISENYEELARQFTDQEIDLAYFGGLTFVRAEHSGYADALVMRDIDTRFTSSFIVYKNAGYQSLEELQGKSLAFGSELSTSGHLMPRYFLQDEYGINSDTFFSSITYSGAHDNTVYLVQKGKVDVGVANTQIVQSMLSDGRLDTTKVDILWETPPYTDYVWAVQRRLNEGLKIKLRNAFLALSKETPEHYLILDSIAADSFLPASQLDFVLLKQVANDLGLLEVNEGD